MTEPTKRPCPICGGSGQRVEWYTELEEDTTNSFAMGAALGTGFFPMNRSVNKQRTVECYFCHGAGQIS